MVIPLPAFSSVVAILSSFTSVLTLTGEAEVPPRPTAAAGPAIEVPAEAVLKGESAKVQLPSAGLHRKHVVGKVVGKGRAALLHAWT